MAPQIPLDSPMETASSIESQIEHQPVRDNLRSGSSVKRTWKTVKKAAVWPPELETALLAALEKYRPATIPLKQLQRFPKRNRFISEYILRATGQHRTPKQVGSRLQQLRDTCHEKRILELLCRRDFSPLPDIQILEEHPITQRPARSRQASSLSSASTSDETQSSFYSSRSPSSPARLDFPPVKSPDSTPAIRDVAPLADLAVSSSNQRPVQTFVCIELLSPDDPFPTKDGDSSKQVGSGFDHSSNYFFRPPVNANIRRMLVVAPTPLWRNNPSVTFTSSTALSPSDHFSYFTVFLSGKRVHAEVTELVHISCTMPNAGKEEDSPSFVYGTKLIPRFWAQVCRNQELPSCIIVQDITKLSTSIPPPHDRRRPVLPSADSPHFQDPPVLSITYSFKCSASIISRIPLSPSHQMHSFPEDPQLPPEFPQVPFHQRLESHIILPSLSPYVFSDLTSTPTPTPAARPANSSIAASTAFEIEQTMQLGVGDFAPQELGQESSEPWRRPHHHSPQRQNHYQPYPRHAVQHDRGLVANMMPPIMTSVDSDRSQTQSHDRRNQGLDQMKHHHHQDHVPVSMSSAPVANAQIPPLLFPSTDTRLISGVTTGIVDETGCGATARPEYISTGVRAAADIPSDRVGDTASVTAYEAGFRGEERIHHPTARRLQTAQVIDHQERWFGDLGFHAPSYEGGSLSPSIYSRGNWMGGVGGDDESERGAGRVEVKEEETEIGWRGGDGERSPLSSSTSVFSFSSKDVVASTSRSPADITTAVTMSQGPPRMGTYIPSFLAGGRELLVGLEQPQSLDMHGGYVWS